MATGTLTQFKTAIPTVAVRMLMDMPQEATGTRKELLVATRHILATDFRTAFIPHLDSLLDERVLVGNGTTSLEILRPLAYSMIADLVHHVRNDLTTDQLSRVVHTYSCNVHDATLPNAIQTMCCKLLLNVIENIVTKDREAAASMLYRMFEAFVRKIEGLAEVRKELVKWARPRDLKRERGQLIDKEYDDVDLERARPVAAVNNMTETTPDPVKGASVSPFGVALLSLCRLVRCPLSFPHHHCRHQDDHRTSEDAKYGHARCRPPRSTLPSRRKVYEHVRGT